MSDLEIYFGIEDFGVGNSFSHPWVCGVGILSDCAIS